MRSSFCIVSARLVKIEPRCEKTRLLGFRPGPTQTGLYSTEDGLKLEISDLERRGIVVSV